MDSCLCDHRRDERGISKPDMKKKTKQKKISNDVYMPSSSIPHKVNRSCEDNTAYRKRGKSIATRWRMKLANGVWPFLSLNRENYWRGKLTH